MAHPLLARAASLLLDHGLIAMSERPHDRIPALAEGVAPSGFTHRATLCPIFDQ